MGMNETVDRLLKEKDHIGSLLRSALSKRMALDSSSRPNELLKVAENGLREAGIDVDFLKDIRNRKGSATTETETLEKQEDGVYTLEVKQAVLESEKKLKCKEETATAAMAARDAAEKSLRMADLRASRLRDRVEELTHQLEESASQRDARRGGSRLRYVCWPWHNGWGSTLSDSKDPKNRH